MLFLYNLSLRFFRIAVFFASWFKPKAKKWIAGRKSWRSVFSHTLRSNEKRIWIHCASLGEFEQGRNLIETLKEQYPHDKVVLTFYSPSGYEIRKNYAYADYVFYLPLDTRSNAQDLVKLIQPCLAIFVKYEFWYHYLHTLQQHKIPVISISAVFRQEQAFFKWYGSFFRKMLSCFTILFVQDENSRQLLEKIGIKNDKVIVAGDTRYDRVATIAASRKQLPLIEAFLQDAPALIAGSTWADDERILQQSMPALPSNWKWIIVPHEIEKTRIREVLQFFPQALLYSELLHGKASSNKQVLIIDNIGLLSSLYAYGKIAFVGGGFQKGGIHNILEPAIYGLPVLFGPIYKKFVEANLLVTEQCCFSVHDLATCQSILHRLATDSYFYQQVHTLLLARMKKQTGATDLILDHIKSLLHIQQPSL